MKPLITVITPSYNNAATIFQTIDSVLSQDYPFIQYIISDDHSENFRREDIENYIHRNNRGNIVEVLVQQTPKNLGISGNLNSAFSHAKGQYIFNVAADDTFYCDTILTEWVQEFEKSGAQVITALRAVCDEHLEKVLYIAPSAKEINIIKNSTPSQLFEAMSGRNMVFGCCTARTKQSYELINGYDEKYPFIEDYPANMKLLRANIPILFWNRIVINYRIGGISSSGRINDAYLKMSEEIFDNEILPYSKNKKRAKREYKLWRADTVWLRDKQLIIGRSKNSNANQNKLKYLLATGAKHPLTAIRKLIT
ncbi:MAG: glycosyltransferase, partial [Clostridia bacterium]|nr:glycosyltransferase [Clostridia bacterium]